MIQKSETPKAQVGERGPDLGLLGGAGDRNRTRMTSLEEMLGERCVSVLTRVLFVTCGVLTAADR
jgi:hypothetical protein